MWGKLILTTLFGLAASAAIAENIDTIDTLESNEAKRKKAPDRSQSVENALLEEHALFDRTFSMELGYSYAHFDRSELILRGFLLPIQVAMRGFTISGFHGAVFVSLFGVRVGFVTVSTCPSRGNHG